MNRICIIPALIRYLYVLVISFLLSASTYAQVDLKVISPKPDSLVQSQNLFISVSADSNYHFASANSVTFYLDDYLITGVTKVSGNVVRFVYPFKIKNGKHTIKIEAKFKEFKGLQNGTWVFYAGKKDGVPARGDSSAMGKDKLKLSGTVSADYRSEMLSGSGQGLRQEPASTSTINVDMVASYKDMEIPVKIFATSDNVTGIQSMNYYQAGFRNKWIDLAAGDLNPSWDPLIVNGIRVRGVGVKLKSKVSSIQVIYGDMTRPVEGSLQLYVPGQGVLPTNLVDSTHYISSGTYKRSMMAARVELGSPTDEIKLCAGVFRAIDDINSIKYGLSPKGNVAGGIDLVIKAFHKKVVVKAGTAMSILTNDITGGAISKQTLDTSYNVKNLAFDPMKLKDIIIMNASTLPANISPAFNNMSFYAQLNYTNKYQSFNVEAKNIGPVYYSLGNPYLLNDYSGIVAGERFSLLKKHIHIGLGYQNYSNDLNLARAMKVYTQGYNGNIMVNPGIKWPSLMFYYFNVARTGTSDIENMPGVNDLLTNYMFSINYGKTIWNINHQLRVMLNMSNRNDQVNPQNKYASTNGMFGISEGLTKTLNVNADIGQTIMTGSDNNKMSDVLVYNFSLDWQIKPKLFFTSVAISNNQMTTYTPVYLYSYPTYRMAYIVRFGVRFFKGMGIDVEGGYQPFIDRFNTVNNYNETYGYIRYTCDLGKLFAQTEPEKKNIK